MLYIVQPPHYNNGVFVGYTELSAYVLNNKEIEIDFRIINVDRSLSKIKTNSISSGMQKYFENTNKKLEDLSDEKLQKLINKLTNDTK